VKRIDRKWWDADTKFQFTAICLIILLNMFIPLVKEYTNASK
jgi:hypothetical protein